MRLTHFPALAVVFLLAAGAANTGDAMAAEDEFILEITGNDQAQVEASCDLATGADRRTKTITGAPPIQRRITAQGLTCTIRQVAEGGRINVSLTSPTGNQQRLGTGGAGSTLRLSME
jgi:hypothetical protein